MSGERGKSHPYVGTHFYFEYDEREEPADLSQKRMTSFEITNYSALLCDTDEQQQNIWVNRDQLDEK